MPKMSDSESADEIVFIAPQMAKASSNSSLSSSEDSEDEPEAMTIEDSEDEEPEDMTIEDEEPEDMIITPDIIYSDESSEVEVEAPKKPVIIPRHSGLFRLFSAHGRPIFA